MSTVRVYELAKELNVSNKEVLDFLKSKNIDLTSHMSNVEDEHVRMVRENFKKGNVSAQSAGKQGEGERPIPSPECQPYAGEKAKTQAAGKTGTGAERR